MFWRVLIIAYSFLKIKRSSQFFAAKENKISDNGSRDRRLYLFLCREALFGNCDDDFGRQRPMQADKQTFVRQGEA